MAGPFEAYHRLRTGAVATAPADPGAGLCASLSSTMDDALRDLFDDLTGAAVVAIGGYGRHRLCLHSDVDVMLLVGSAEPTDVTRAVLYPLWDAKVAVGHSVRTPEEAVTAAGEGLETLCSLLTARVVAGDADLLDEVFDGLGRLVRRPRALGDRLAAEIEERRAAAPYRLLAVDVKQGRGGLRTLDALAWDRIGADLAAGRRPEPIPRHPAADVLLAIRNGLHAVTDRAFDRYEPDLRGSVADWLGTDPVPLGRRLYGAARDVEAEADARWPDLRRSVRDDPVALTGRWVVRALRSLRSERGGDVDRSPVLDLAVALLDDPARRFTDEDRRVVAAAPAPEWTADDRRALVRLLAAGRRGQEVFEALASTGWVDRAIPEYGHVVAAPQISPVHLHTVDDHLWRTVHELSAITSAASDEESWTAEIAEDLGSLDDALLAAFLHDVGKGLPGDHSEVGAELAERLTRRLGFDERRVRRIARVVRHHLLLSETASRRDLGDPGVIEELADAVGDATTLRVLYLVSIADARATGPTVWTDWKRALLRHAFGLVLDALEGQGPDHDDVDVMAEAIASAADGRWTTSQIVEHLDGMPAGYVRRFEADEVARHLDLVTPPPRRGEVRVGVEAGDPSASVIVVTVDRPGVLADVSGVLALHNLAVMDARVVTRADGVAVDSFAVTDALGRGAVPVDRLEGLRTALPRYLSGERDLAGALAVKSTTYAGRAPDAPASVRIRREGDRSVVEVRCGDRVGLLHDLGQVLFEHGLSIWLARVDTRAERVVDVFYVDPIDDDAARALESDLLSVVR